MNGLTRPPDREVEKRIWMQYTGLKDKNGKEIYESVAKPNNYHLSNEPDFYEVIGNIYENPELLEKSE